MPPNMLAHDDELQSLFMNITNLDTPSIYDYEMCLRLMFFVCVYKRLSILLMRSQRLLNISTIYHDFQFNSFCYATEAVRSHRIMDINGILMYLVANFHLFLFPLGWWNFFVLQIGYYSLLKVNP